jgi:hypothetical protein
MIAIWKTNLKLIETQNIQVPAGAELLCAREQRDKICLWYRCDTEAPPIYRRILIVGTGTAAEATIKARYLGTAITDGSQFVWHVFEGRQ